MFRTPGSRVVTKKKPIIAIATSGNGLTAASFFTAAQLASPKRKRLLVPAGVVLGAFLTGTGFVGGLDVWIYGDVDGLGGVGSTTAGVAGGDGGDAIRFDQDDVTVRVKGGGRLRGGAGGGGKGGAGSSTVVEGPYFSNSGYPYSGWFYVGGGQVNIYYLQYGGGPNWIIYTGASSYSPGDGWLYYDAGGGSGSWHSIARSQTQSTVGGNGGRGVGYDGAKANGVTGGTSAGAGGNGGDWGESGTTGANGNSTPLGSAGGAAGKAANLNGRSNCTVINEGGTVLGLVA